MHMIEHEIVMAVSAPLIVLCGRRHLWCGVASASRASGGEPDVQRCPLRVAWTSLTGGLLATPLHGAAIWVWRHLRC